MNCIYDIDSDHLKCNFCTNYFKCTFHFANLQRYALKACPNCLNNFSFSLLHPHTYTVYRIFLLDTALTLSPDAPNPLQQAQQQAESRLCAHFEQKITALMAELAKIRQNLQSVLQKVYKQYADLEAASRLDEIEELLQRVREYEVNGMVAEKGRLQLGERRELKSSRMTPLQEKENIPSNNYSNASKMIKSKICGSSSRVLSSGKSTLSRSISKSIIKSILAQEENVRTEDGNADRSEVSRLLQTKSCFDSYLPRDVVKPSSVWLKSEGSRNAVEAVLQLRNRTARTPEIIELIGGDASRTNFPCYLRTLNEYRQAKTVRMIRCSLVDADMDHLLHFLAESPLVETLIVTNNRLTDLSVEALCAFKQRHPHSRLANAYLGNNMITSRAPLQISPQQGPALTIHL